MTHEDKQLLLKDLCARLPYGVKVKCEMYPFPVTVLYAGNVDEVKFEETGGIEHIVLIKPYLRPMSSMTNREKYDYVHMTNFYRMDFCYEHYLDFRGLIEKGLALEVPEEMYKTE